MMRVDLPRCKSSVVMVCFTGTDSTDGGDGALDVSRGKYYSVSHSGDPSTMAVFDLLATTQQFL